LRVRGGRARRRYPGGCLGARENTIPAGSGADRPYPDGPSPRLGRPRSSARCRGCTRPLLSAGPRTPRPLPPRTPVSSARRGTPERAALCAGSLSKSPPARAGAARRSGRVLQPAHRESDQDSDGNNEPGEHAREPVTAGDWNRLLWRRREQVPLYLVVAGQGAREVSPHSGQGLPRREGKHAVRTGG
jgi:hypothetical protein